MRSEKACVHLRILGNEHSFELPFVPGPTTLMEVLPTARELTARTLEAAARSSGQSPTCRQGCEACCRHLVMLTGPEAFVLRAAIATMPEAERARFEARLEAALRRAEQTGILGRTGSRAFLAAEALEEEALLTDVARRYFELGIPCPFLDNEACTVYAERPLACREYTVSSDPSFCATFAHPLTRLIAKARVTRAFGRAAQALAGTRDDGVPLLLLLEWTEAEREKLARKHDGIDVLRAFLRELGRVEERDDGADRAP